MRSPLRSVVAVVVGFVVIGALSFGTSALLGAWRPDLFDAANMMTAGAGALLVAVAYVGVYATFGCYLAARLAPERPMLHAMVLGVLGLAFNVLGTVREWGTAPAWYFVVSLLLVLPYAWLGGWLRERELGRAPAGAVAAGA